MLVLGLDTGGTFTDAVLYHPQTQRILRSTKTPTTHFDYAICIQNAIEALALSPQERQQLMRMHLSTTLATNAVAEQHLSPTALLLERGDVRPPDQLHPQLVILNSAMSFEGHTVRAVSKSDILQKTAPLAGLVSAFAVSGYASTRNPAHERAIGAILEEAYQKPVVLGCQLTSRLNFAQRARAAVLNASLLPVILDWLQAVRHMLKQQQLDVPLYVVKGDGSLMNEAEAAAQPVQTLLSGPAASLRGGAWLCAPKEPSVVVVDVGGTTTDIGHAQKGEGRLRLGGLEIDGHQVAVDGLDMQTHALGGDSGLRLVGGQQLLFGPLRCQPFCRLGEWGHLNWLDALETAAEEFWHFGDISHLTLVVMHSKAQHACQQALTEYGHHHPNPNPTQQQANQKGLQALQTALYQGPQRLVALTQTYPITQRQFLNGALNGLFAKRLLMRAAFTPTDLACLQHKASPFDTSSAKRMLALYAKVLEMPPEELLQRLVVILQRQAVQTLAQFFLTQSNAHSTQSQPFPSAVWQMLAKHLCAENPLQTEGAKEAKAPVKVPPCPTKPATLHMHPHSPVALVGAGAQAVFCHVPRWLQPHVRCPTHREAANAVGAAVSRFLIRQHASVEPVENKTGFVIYTHQAPQTRATLAQALQSAKEVMRQHLLQRAQALNLQNVSLTLEEEVLEDDEGFTRKTRKIFLMARVWATLTADPPAAYRRSVP